MKIQQFKLWLMMLITSATLIAQTENIYSKSFETNSNTTALLKLSGGSVEIELSPDDKFYLEYSIDFENYPNRKKKDVIEKVQIQAKIIDNHITLVDNSNFYNYRLNRILGMLYRKDTLKEKKYNQKSKALILSEIKDYNLTESFYIEYLKHKYRNDKEKRDELINRYNRKKKRKVTKSFIIKVPSHLALTIDAKHTIIRINSDLKNKLSVRLDGGKLITKSIHNQENIIKIKDAVFVTESINGGELSLNNIKRGLIGSINNTKLSAEFSNLEIGELQKNNRFTGFSNSFVMHNFSDDFSEFNLLSEYSKIHYFKLNTDYAINAYGFNTVVNVNNVIQKLEPTKNGEKIEFFKIKSSGKGLFSGTINFDITHGFIFIH